LRRAHRTGHQPQFILLVYDTVKLCALRRHLAMTQKPVLLVTGASSGIGDGIARRFAAGGYSIVAVARRKDRLERLAAELSGTTDVAVLAADVTAEDAPQAAVALAMKSFGRLDCLVNNAGSGKWAPVHETDDATLNEVIDISLKAPFRFAREALGVMTAGASIISVGSTFGILGGLNGGGYCAAKAGLIGLTQALAVQYGANGIRSNLVAPSVIKTDMTKDYWDLPAFQRVNQEMTPSDRDGTIADVANAVFFLASDQAGFINGQTLALDGGWSTTKFLSYQALVAKREPS
jgi:meso-butanediol dehydrogenase / (S,S)-butanediol dehydrogenase / diacetyl reductase